MPSVYTLFSIPAVRIATLLVGGCILAALIFDAGVDVGAHRMGLGGPGRFMAFGVPLPHGYMTHGHGAVGTISNVGTSTVTIAEMDGDSDVVWVTGSTSIETSQGPGTLASLSAGMRVIVIGTPDEARDHIGATLIRVLPPPPQQ